MGCKSTLERYNPAKSHSMRSFYFLQSLLLLCLLACFSCRGQSTVVPKVQSVTFSVCDVERGVEPVCRTDEPANPKAPKCQLPYREAVIAQAVTTIDLQEKISKKAALRKAARESGKDPEELEPGLPRKIEALRDRGGELLRSNFHPFVESVHMAYARHHSLTISPDMIWLLIAQGFAVHVNENTEALRGQFVDFEGKKTLIIRRDGFVKGGTNNDWPGTFAEFSKQIEANTGPGLLDLVTGDFSTTGPAEKAAFQITLMDAMQGYFEYTMMTLCGIPEVTLEGTPEDWRQIEEKTKQLAQYDLEWWVNDLLPVLKEFTAAAEGKENRVFWESIYKYNALGSGDEFITGWVLNFFPYRYNEGKYSRMVPEEVVDRDGNKLTVRKATTGEFPSGLSRAPFMWDYKGTPFAMELTAGFVGYRQDIATLALRPEISWAVVDLQRKPTKEVLDAYKKGGNEAYLRGKKN